MKKKLLAILSALGLTLSFAGCVVNNGDSSQDASSSDSSSACTHIFDNDCDADCNECGETRTPSEHVYDGEGDKDCNVCGDTRELDKFTVAFNVDGGEAVDSMQVEYGTAATEFANVTTTKVGYNFAGWTMEDGSEIPANATVTNNITLKAKWDIVTYTAKIVRADGGEEAIEFTIENRGEKLAAIALTANDAQYTYAWANALPAELSLNNDQVFTETRTVNDYTVTFNVDGGSVVEMKTVPYGTPITELANFTSTKTGYTFKCWMMEDGSEIPANAIITSNMTVKAKWDIVTYTAKIARADGSEETVEFTIENRTEKLAAIALTANDAQYTYAWANALPAELSLNNDQVFTETRTVNNYMVTFDVDGGSAVEMKTVPYGTPAAELAKVSSTKTGYVFKGWTMEDGSEIPGNATITSNTTVKAAWAPATDTAYTVGVYLASMEGYSETATQTIKGVGTTNEAVEINYDWMTEYGLSIPTGYSLDSEKSVLSGVIAANGSLELKVYLKLNEYMVTINGQTSTAKHGATLSLPENPTKGGYIFKEWQIDGVKVDETYVVNGDTTVVAIWYVDLTVNSLFELDLSSSGDYTIATTGLGKVTAASIDGVDLRIVSTDNSMTIENAVIAASGVKGGEYSNLVLVTADAEYMVKYIAVTKYLSAENVTSWATLKSIIEADMNGYYVLTGNINLAAAGNNSQRATRAIGFGAVSGTAHTNYTEFNGTLDGRGYAIQNLEYNWRADGGNHDHSLFDVIAAKGVVKNLALTNVKVVVSGSRIASLAWTNKGTIENCYVDYTNTAGVGAQNADYGQAVMALINDGTIRDSITKLTTTASTGTNRLSAVTAKNNGTVSNVNSIVSIISDVDPVSVFINNGTSVNSNCYTTADALFESGCGANYTSDYWTIDAAIYTIKFGELVILAPAVQEASVVIEMDKSSSQDLNLDISGIGTNIRSLTLGGESVDYAVKDKTLSISYDQISTLVGEYELVIDMGTSIYSYKVIFVTKYLSAENVTSWATLKSIIEADMNGYYVLTSDINLAAAGGNSQRATRAIGFGAVSGTSHTNYTEFNGTLDGRGYAIQNLEYNWRADGGNHDQSLFDVIGAKGVVKNLALTNVKVVVSGVRIAALAWTNKGTIENCYVDYTNTAGVGGQNAEWGQAVMVLINEGTIKDSITKLTTTASTGTNRLSAVTAKNTGTVSNVSSIVSIISDVDPVSVFVDNGTTTNSACYNDVAAFYTANGDAGYTSSYWTFDKTNNTITFGSVGKVL